MCKRAHCCEIESGLRAIQLTLNAQRGPIVARLHDAAEEGGDVSDVACLERGRMLVAAETMWSANGGQLVSTAVPSARRRDKRGAVGLEGEETRAETHPGDVESHVCEGADDVKVELYLWFRHVWMVSQRLWCALDVVVSSCAVWVGALASTIVLPHGALGKSGTYSKPFAVYHTTRLWGLQRSFMFMLLAMSGTDARTTMC